MMLAFLSRRREEHMLIMLPNGPGFAESLSGVHHHDTVPLPLSHC
jgi:hypothetical protein